MDYENIYSVQVQNLSDSELRDHNELRKAIRCKDKEMVEYLVRHGARVNGIFGNISDSAYHTPLHLAVLSRRLEIVKILLDKGADVDGKILHGETPLTLAAKSQNVALIDLLLSYNLQDTKNADGFSHLHVACMRNNIEVVKKLILMNHGRNINSAVKYTSLHWAGYSPLHFAVHFECIETVRFLLDSGADILAKDAKYSTPLHLADFIRNEEMVDTILAAHKREYRNPINWQGISHFHIACTRDDTSVVEHFLKFNQDINQSISMMSHWKGWRPIHFAIYYECPEVIKLLLKSKIQLKAECMGKLISCAFMLKNRTIYDLFTVIGTESNDSPRMSKFLDLLVAILKDDFHQIQLFLTDRVIGELDLHIFLSTSCFPLHLAVKYKSGRVIALLLDNGADTMAQDAKDETPVHIAFSYGAKNEIFLQLIEKLNKKTINLINNEGLSIFHILCSTSRIALIEMLIMTGLDINAQVGCETVCWAGYTAMHFAAHFGQPQVVETLLNHGADLTITNALNLSPYDLTINLFASDLYAANEKSAFDILMKISSFASNEFIDFNDRGVSPLHAACVDASYDLELLKRSLITYKDQLNQAVEWPQSLQWHKSTPLHFAMKFCAHEHAKMMLDAGADLFALNCLGEAPIAGFRDCGDELECKRKLCQNLIDHICEEDATQYTSGILPFDTSQFYLLCVSSFDTVVDNFIDNVTDENLKKNFLNCHNDIGQTPLHLFFLRRYGGQVDFDNAVNVFENLLNSGANVNVRDYELQTPLHIGQLENAEGVPLCHLTDLVENGANVNARNIYGETPLLLLYEFVFQSDRPHNLWTEVVLEQVNSLLGNGSDINITDRQGRTCLMMVESQDHELDGSLEEGMARLLLEHVAKMQVLGYSFSERNSQAYDNIVKIMDETIYNESAFVAKCMKEINLMMSTRVDRYTTLYDILRKSSSEMISYCENVHLGGMVEPDDFVEKFPIYGLLTKLNIRNGKIRRPLLSRCIKSLQIILGKSMPHECVERILRLLSNVDLESIVLTEKLYDSNDELTYASKQSI